VRSQTSVTGSESGITAEGRLDFEMLDLSSNSDPSMEDRRGTDLSESQVRGYGTSTRVAVNYVTACVSAGKRMFSLTLLTTRFLSSSLRRLHPLNACELFPRSRLFDLSFNVLSRLPPVLKCRKFSKVQKHPLYMHFSGHLHNEDPALLE
jgi:hypothetical protein